MKPETQPPAAGEAAHTPLLHLDPIPDAQGFQTIRPDDGTENGDTEMNPIATVYAGPDVAAFIVRACNGWNNPAALRARLAELEDKQ